MIETFEQFMQRALHDPVQGYYRQGLSIVGSGGDFSTSSTLFPDLAKALAGWIRHRARVLKGRGPVHVIEVGAGSGDLMLGILKNLGWWQRRRFCFHSVESSEPLGRQQREKLLRYGVHWHPDMPDALKAAGGEALIYSNELVDAFPCIVLGFQEGQWKELSLDWTEREPVEVWSEPAGLRIGKIVEEVSGLCPEPGCGRRLEIPWSYREWMESWLPGWKKGSLLTIDYGNEAGELMRLHRFGTLRSYFRHLRLEGPEVYRRAGQQDITFDVNFSLLMKWGEESGLENISLSTQSDFIEKQGIQVSGNFGSKQAQEMFHVLEQRRD